MQTSSISFRSCRTGFTFQASGTFPLTAIPEIKININQICICIITCWMFSNQILQRIITSFYCCSNSYLLWLRYLPIPFRLLSILFLPFLFFLPCPWFNCNTFKLNMASCIINHYCRIKCIKCYLVTNICFI